MHHIAHATHAVPLDFNVSFSSLAALLGSPGQANYAAANATMDEVAQLAQRSGLPHASLQWGAWLGPGMAEVNAAKMKELGMGAIQPAAGSAMILAILARMAAGSIPAQLAVSDFDWQRVQGSSSAKTMGSLLQGLVAKAGTEVWAKENGLANQPTTSCRRRASSAR